MSYAKEIAGTILYQLETLDPMFIGTLGIRPKEISEENKNVTLTFDASLVVINGKKYKGWIMVEYDYPSDTYEVRAEAVRGTKHHKSPVSKDVYAEDLWDSIHRLVSF